MAAIDSDSDTTSSSSSSGSDNEHQFDIDDDDDRKDLRRKCSHCQQRLVSVDCSNDACRVCCHRIALDFCERHPVTTHVYQRHPPHLQPVLVILDKLARLRELTAAADVQQQQQQPPPLEPISLEATNQHLPDAVSRDEHTCTVCMEYLIPIRQHQFAPFIWLKCGHVYHDTCINAWLERNHTCPTCRQHIHPPFPKPLTNFNVLDRVQAYAKRTDNDLNVKMAKQCTYSVREHARLARTSEGRQVYDEAVNVLQHMEQVQGSYIDDLRAKRREFRVRIQTERATIKQLTTELEQVRDDLNEEKHQHAVLSKQQKHMEMYEHYHTLIRKMRDQITNGRQRRQQHHHHQRAAVSSQVATGSGGGGGDDDDDDLPFHLLKDMKDREQVMKWLEQDLRPLVEVETQRTADMKAQLEALREAQRKRRAEADGRASKARQKASKMRDKYDSLSAALQRRRTRTGKV